MLGRPFGIILLAAALLAAGILGDRRILGGFSKDFQYISSRGAVCSDVELRVHRRGLPYVASQWFRSYRLYGGNGITVVPVVVRFSRGQGSLSSRRWWLFFFSVSSATSISAGHLNPPPNQRLQHAGVKIGDAPRLSRGR